jgi:hypothetical protein
MRIILAFSSKSYNIGIGEEIPAYIAMVGGLKPPKKNKGYKNISVTL